MTLFVCCIQLYIYCNVKEIDRQIQNTIYLNIMSSKADVLGYFVPTALLSQIFSTLLSLEDICRFDSAICNKIKRLLYLECIQSASCICVGEKDQDLSSNAISWLRYRSIKIRHLKCSRINDDIAIKIGAFGSCLRLLSIRYENGF